MNSQSTSNVSIRYGKLQQEGAKLQDLMENASLPCTIPRCTLTSADLFMAGWTFNARASQVPGEVRYIDPALGRPIAGDQGPVYTRAKKDWNLYMGENGQGVIFMEDLMNRPGNEGPYTAQIAQAMYTHSFSLADLCRVFVLTVLQEDTRSITKQIYDASRTDYMVLDYGNPEFQAVLGSKIGKTVAYLILGAFPRGTARISKICLWQMMEDAEAIQMQFDIARF